MNVELMTAEMAFNEATYRNEANEILRNIKESIQEACDRGFYKIEMNVNQKTPKGVIDLVLEELTNKGYDAKFYLDTLAACEHYWDRIIIDWNVRTYD